MLKFQKYVKLSIAFVLLMSFTCNAFADKILTVCEQSNFQKYSNHQQMMEFLGKVQANSNEMLLSTYGKSVLGRELVYAVFSRPMVTNPWEAMISGKPIVILDGGIHGLERTLRESNLMLIRELATSGTEMNKLLDKLVIIMVPCLNPDGTEVVKRTNANGVDINRDFIKLDEPESRYYVENILQKWHPHLQVNGHNGGAYPYNVCYVAPTNAQANPRLSKICDDEIFPLLDKNLQQAGYKSFYYGNGNQEKWTTGESAGRVLRNYGGLSNYVSIVFEMGVSQPRKPGVISGLVAYKSILQYCASNGNKLMDVVEKARFETIQAGQKAQGQIALQTKYVAEDYKVSYWITERKTKEKNADANSDDSANDSLPAKDSHPNIVQISNAMLIKKPLAAKTRPRPYAYLLDAKAVKVIELLRRHNITVEVLQKDMSIPIEAYILKSVKYKKQYNHPQSVLVSVDEKTVRQTIDFPKGTYIIRTGQVMGNVISHMLEPETEDSVIVWNKMDDLLPKPGTDSLIPIYRITEPIQLPAMLCHE